MAIVRGGEDGGKRRREGSSSENWETRELITSSLQAYRLQEALAAGDDLRRHLAA